MKKKILAICLVAIVAVTAIAGATLAYFTDTDTQVNTFTVGNVKIDLFEDFNSAKLNLVPAVIYTNAETGETVYRNTIEKEVYVTNTGLEEAFVRVHIALPAFTRNNESIDVFSLLNDKTTAEDGLWIWGDNANSNYPESADELNTYADITIKGVPYKVYVLTYETALKSGETTYDAINKVYMDPATTNEEIEAWNTQYADEFGSPVWQCIYVVAEAVQADGFDDAVTALDTAFGKPGTYDIDWSAAPKGNAFKEWLSKDGTN